MHAHIWLTVRFPVTLLVDVVRTVTEWNTSVFSKDVVAVKLSSLSIRCSVSSY